MHPASPGAEKAHVPPAGPPALEFVVDNPEGALQASLLSLVMRVPGARSASLAGANGLPIASTLSANSDRVASAMAAMIARTAHVVLDAMGRNRLLSVVVEGSARVVLVCEVSEGLGTLMLVVDRTGDVDAARREIVRTVMEITTILDLDVG